MSAAALTPRDPACQLEERRAKLRAWLASQGMEMHTTRIGNLNFTECRKIGAPSAFEGVKARLERGQP